jgi:hypothetical protein
MKGQVDFMLIVKIVLALAILALAVYLIKVYILTPGTGPIPGEGLINP